MGSLLWVLYVSNAPPFRYPNTYCFTDGRRPVYLCSLTCQCIGSLGVASAWSVPSLLMFRMVQAFGTSSGLSVGMGVIADIYKLEERGTASGIFWGVSHTYYTSNHYTPFLTIRIS